MSPTLAALVFLLTVCHPGLQVSHVHSGGPRISVYRRQGVDGMVVTEDDVAERVASRSQIHCSVVCRLHPGCVAFWRHPSSGVCELYKAMRQQQDTSGPALAVALYGMSCGAGPEVGDGVHVTTNGSVSGSQAHFSCAVDFRLRGASRGQCDEDGQWRVPRPSPRCLKVAWNSPQFPFTMVSPVPVVPDYEIVMRGIAVDSEFLLEIISNRGDIMMGMHVRAMEWENTDFMTVYSVVGGHTLRPSVYIPYLPFYPGSPFVVSLAFKHTHIQMKYTSYPWFQYPNLVPPEATTKVRWSVGTPLYRIEIHFP